MLPAENVDGIVTRPIGGMGVVVAAHHLQLDEKVVIKFLLAARGLDMLNA
jgi:hypothetical protein